MRMDMTENEIQDDKIKQIKSVEPGKDNNSRKVEIYVFFKKVELN